ncbi:hypothetical protein H8S10_17725 [Clostridium sp. NSJ-49]|jgi:hypothetical protein|uniref:Uncharacterized protein n=1 Tax=Clostridium disporicum TaxID=84024 RepID=A0A174K9C7_9CLOT|nr:MULTISPECIES: hypothetical protein [Clostridium]MBC5627232.1 hypothetical protein [Clostridium sp. NSJ-49]CUP08582.1 Uncharacterised protein [Clostridium disporicum]
MYKIEIKELGENKVSLCETIKYLQYNELYNLVKPYLNIEHLSFSIRNDCPDGREWGFIYAGDTIVGEIKITKLFK